MHTKSISSTSPVYVPSGRFSGITYFILAVSTFVILPILSIINSFITWYSPIIYINLIVTVLTGVVLGGQYFSNNKVWKGKVLST